MSCFFLSANDPTELWAVGPSARADCSRARISARGNDFNPLKLSGVVPEAHSAEGTYFLSLLYLCCHIIVNKDGLSTNNC